MVIAVENLALQLHNHQTINYADGLLINYHLGRLGDTLHTFGPARSRYISQTTSNQPVKKNIVQGPNRHCPTAETLSNKLSYKKKDHTARPISYKA